MFELERTWTLKMSSRELCTAVLELSLGCQEPGIKQSNSIIVLGVYYCFSPCIHEINIERLLTYNHRAQQQFLESAK